MTPSLSTAASFLPIIIPPVSSEAALSEVSFSPKTVPVRSFVEELGSRIEALSSRYIVDTLGVVGYDSGTYPIYRIVVAAEDGDPRTAVVLSGGVHGDEPAGPKALLEFLENHADQYLDRFRFIVYPCVNPSGYEADTRCTRNGIDLNRSFGDTLIQPEVTLIKADLVRLGLRYRFTMDLHEDRSDSSTSSNDLGPNGELGTTGCYIYETQLEPSKRIGRAIMDSLPQGTEICTWDNIYGDPSDRGLISYSPSTTGNAEFAQTMSLDSHLFANFTDHSFTTETPTCWGLGQRIATGLHFVTRALEEIGRQS